MFKKIGSIAEFNGPVLVDRVLKNSITVAVMDSVKTASGFVLLGTTGARVLGHVESIVGQDGLTPVKDGTYLGNFASTYATASDNQTVAQIRARVDVSTYSLYSAELDAAAGTTTGSNLGGVYFNIVDEDTLDESTVVESLFSLTEGTPNVVSVMQYYSLGLDRNKTTQVVAKITNSEVFGF